MANRLQIRRGTGAPGGVFYEGEPIFDKTGKILYVGDNGAAGSGSGSPIASGVAYDTVLEMLTQAAQGSAGVIKLQENGSNGNHYIGLTAPASVSSTFTFILPDGDGFANQVLKTDGSGNLGFSTVVSSFNIDADSGTTDLVNTGETITFAGTLNEIETTVSNNQIQFGLPNTVTVTTGLNINSSQKLSISETAILQRSGDLTIQTNGVGDSTGDDIIINAHDDVEIQVAAGTTAIYATGGGSVKLNNNGSTKLETTGGGITVTGDVRADRILLDDNEPINMGQSSDMVIKHDGTDNHITSVNDKDLNIELAPDGGTPKIYIRPTQSTQGITLGGGSGNPVELYHSNAKKFETTGSGASVTGDLYVSGNLNVVGTAVTFSTETVKVEDRFMELGLVDGSEPTSGNTTWDLGVLFNYNTGAQQGTAKKSGIVWLDNSFIAAVGVATETTGVGSTMPQLNITSYADFIAKDLYLGGTAPTNLVINSSGEAQNLVFDGGSY